MLIYFDLCDFMHDLLTFILPCYLLYFFVFAGYPDTYCLKWEEWQLLHLLEVQ